jgi:hypothetical protein
MAVEQLSVLFVGGSRGRAGESGVDEDFFSGSSSVASPPPACVVPALAKNARTGPPCVGRIPRFESPGHLPGMRRIKRWSGRHPESPRSSSRAEGSPAQTHSPLLGSKSRHMCRVPHPCAVFAQGGIPRPEPPARQEPLDGWSFLPVPELPARLRKPGPPARNAKNKAVEWASSREPAFFIAGRGISRANALTTHRKQIAPHAPSRWFHNRMFIRHRH